MLEVIGYEVSHVTKSSKACCSASYGQRQSEAYLGYTSGCVTNGYKYGNKNSFYVKINRLLGQFLLNMWLSSLSATALILGTSVASTLTDQSILVSEGFLSTLRSARPFHAQNSPERSRTCIATSHNDEESDDAEYILQAVRDCHEGGHVILAAKLTYTIASPLNLTGLSAIDIDIQGRISFPPNLEYWQKNTFDLEFQNATSFFILGGEDVNVYGGGEVDGHGQAWWDAYVKNKKIRRPILFTIDGLKTGSVSEIKLRNSPQWANLIANSSDVVYSGLEIFSTSDNENFEKNTDGWDIYRSTRITIENSTITNGDGQSRLKKHDFRKS